MCSDLGWAKMAALKPNVQTIFDNNVNAVLQVMQGQADIAGTGFLEDGAALCDEEGAAWRCRPRRRGCSAASTP